MIPNSWGTPKCSHVLVRVLVHVLICVLSCACTCALCVLSCACTCALCVLSCACTCAHMCALVCLYVYLNPLFLKALIVVKVISISTAECNTHHCGIFPLLSEI